jgi:hypothetical protein
VANLRKIPYTKPLPPDAEVFTRKVKGEVKRFARWTDAKGKRREAELTEDGTRVRLLSKKWYGEWRDPDGTEHCEPLATDEVAAGQMLAERVRKAELRHAGVADPFEGHRQRPLAEHLDDFERALLAKGGGARHVRDVKARIRRVLDGCRFVFLSDLSASRA